MRSGNWFAIVIVAVGLWFGYLVFTDGATWPEVVGLLAAGLVFYLFDTLALSIFNTALVLVAIVVGALLWQGQGDFSIKIPVMASNVGEQPPQATMPIVIQPTATPIFEATVPSEAAPVAEEGAPVDCADAGLNATEPCEGGIVEHDIELPSEVSLWPGGLTVVDTIYESAEWAQDDFAIPWPPHIEIDREKCPLLNDVNVWCSYEARPGAFVIFVATGISTPTGTYEGCVGGWFYNPTDEQITIKFNQDTTTQFKVRYSEAVDIARAQGETTLDVDTMARYLTLRATSTNGCGSSAYLGQVLLFSGQPVLDLQNLPFPE